jgi:hypothetical protein
MRYAYALIALLLVGCRPQAELPPIPQAVPSPLGPVPIVWADSLKDPDGNVLLGGFSGTRRAIYLRNDLKRNPRVAYAVFRHEVCHLVLEDSGLGNILPIEHQQAVCDAIAAYAVAELLLSRRKR